MDSSLIEADCDRTDITVYKVEATKLAEEKGLSGLSNMILLGKAMKECAFLSDEGIDKGLQKSIPPKKANLLDSNRDAIKLGKIQ